MRDDVVDRVVERVAAVTGREQSDLPPLYEAVDADAMAAIAGPEVGVRFEYAGCRVTIVDGYVSTCEPVGERVEGAHE